MQTAQGTQAASVATAHASYDSKAYALLLSMADASKIGEQAKTKAKEALDGAYNIGVACAIACSSLPVFIATIEKLEDNIRMGRDKLHVKFGAPPRDKEGKDGAKYKVPSSVSTVKTVMKAAFEFGVAMVAKDAKTGEVRALAFSTIRKLNTAARDAQKVVKAEQAVAALSGIDLDRHNVALLCQAISNLAPAFTPDAVANALNILGALHDALKPATVLAGMPTNEAPVVGKVSTTAAEVAHDVLAKEASAAPQTKAQGRKRAKKAA